MKDDQGAEEPVGYMERTRLYYRALGYDRDYIWSHYGDVPFARLGMPLQDARLALVTTASPPGLTNRDARGRKQVWFGAVAEPPAAFETEVAWDRESTHTDDRESYLPITAACGLAADGVFGGLSAHFVGAPTKYSQRETLEVDAPQVLERLRADGADGAILTAL